MITDLLLVRKMALRLLHDLSSSSESKTVHQVTGLIRRPGKKQVLLLISPPSRLPATPAWIYDEDTASQPLTMMR